MGDEQTLANTYHGVSLGYDGRAHERMEVYNVSPFCLILRGLEEVQLGKESLLARFMRQSMNRSWLILEWFQCFPH